ncbi:MAG: heavy metal translocating P-type ATPase [Akkermansiaceae bacterium]|nr:heavy metal translocating P-type ATPase [Akkermansiaceae bacterium]
MEEKNYLVSGMHCAGCAAKVERAVGELQGVESVELNLLTGRMTVVFREHGSPARSRMAEVVEKAGFQLADWVDGTPSGRDEEEKAEDAGGARLVWSVLLLLPLMYLSMGPMWSWPAPSGEWGVWANLWGQCLLAALILWLNRRYLVNGVRQLASLSPNMDSLIAIGSGSAFLYGLFLLCGGMLRRGRVDTMELYFESAAMIVTLISLGKYLERRSYRKTNAAVKGLVNLIPREALVWHDGEERAVPLNELQVDDLIVVKTGQRVPVDGVITEGQAALDESDLTGESMPVDKSAGDRVISGTFNRAGYLKVRAERVGGDSTLARMIRLVEQAGQSKAPIARLADRVCYFFVPAVIVIALAAFGIWLAAGEGFSFALARAIAVLVISCPCVLGLATPIAIMVGTGRGARLGILCKSASALEALSRVDTVVFDKTGTLTVGEPRVVAVLPEHGMDADELMEVAAALEQGSGHPVGKAVYEHARMLELPVRPVADLSIVPGRGIAGTVDGVPYVIGNLAFMQEKGISWEEEQGRFREFMRQGASPLYVGREGRPAGAIMVADSLKPDSLSAVDNLKRMQMRVVMLTGDNAATARHMAEELHIDEVVSDVLPDEKASHIMKMEKAGARVAMVGDGVNDAPALACAQVGISLKSGTDLAMESSDIVLMKNHPRGVAEALQLGRATLHIIRQNLFWAFFYNTIGIPLSAGALYPAFGITLNPMIAAAAMSLSSLCVVFNSLRLRTFKPHLEK